MSSMAVHTWTDSPRDAVRNQLRFLSHVNNATRLLEGGLGCSVKREIAQDIGSRKARQLSACIQQAEEYYNAAGRATIATSPLLLFYGMLSLAKALVVANHPTLLLENINYHDLKRAKGESDYVRSGSKTFWRPCRTFLSFMSGITPSSRSVSACTITSLAEPEKTTLHFPLVSTTSVDS